MNYYDKTGRLIKPGDLLKIYHFTEFRRKRKIYMYRLVVMVNEELKVCKDGQHMYAMSVTNGAEKPSIFNMSIIGECEIIDSIAERDQNGNLAYWWERKCETL